MTELYMKDQNGNYLPVKFEKMVTKEWEGCLVLVSVGTEENPATSQDEDEVLEAIGGCDFEGINDNVSFVVTSRKIDFKNLGPIENLKRRILNDEDVVSAIADLI